MTSVQSTFEIRRPVFNWFVGVFTVCIFVWPLSSAYACPNDFYSGCTDGCYVESWEGCDYGDTCDTPLGGYCYQWEYDVLSYDVGTGYCLSPCGYYTTWACGCWG